MKKLFICLVALTLCLSTQLAFSAPKYWIERDGGVFGTEYLTDGKSQYSSGMFGTFDWIDEAKKNPAFSETITQRNSDLQKGNIIYWSGFALIIGSVFVPRDFFWPTFLGGIGLNLWGAHFGLKARQQDLEMINRSNGVTIKSTSSSLAPALTLAITY